MVVDAVGLAVVSAACTGVDPARRTATWASVSFGFLPGGIAFEATCSMIRLSPLLPGTTAAPVSPPWVIEATVRRSSPPFRASPPWHLTQWSRRIGATSLSNRGGSARELRDATGEDQRSTWRGRSRTETR